MSFSVSWVYQAVDKFTPVARRVQKIARRVTKDIKINGNAFAFVSRKANRYNRILNVVDHKMKKFSKNLDHNLRGLTRLGEGFKSVGKSMSLAVTLPIAAFTTLAIISAAKLEDTRISFEVLTGSVEAGRKVYDRMINFVRSTPFRLEPIQKATKTLLAFGVGNEKVESVIKTLGDIAAGSGQDISALALVYGQVTSTGRLLAQDANQFAQRGIGLYNELAIMTGKSVAEIKKIGEAGGITSQVVERVFKRMTSEGGRFFRATEKLAKSLSGIFAIAMSEISLGFGEIGEVIVKTFGVKALLVEKFIPALRSMVEWIKKFTKENPKLSKFILIITAMIAIIGPLLVGLGLAISAFKLLAFVTTASLWPVLLTIGAVMILTALYFTFSDSIDEALNNLGPFGRMIVLTTGFIALASTALLFFGKKAFVIKGAIMAWTVAQWLLNAALAANPIGLIVIALAAAFVGIFIFISKVKELGGVMNALKAVWNGFIDLVLVGFSLFIKAIDLIAGTDLTAKFEEIKGLIKFEVPDESPIKGGEKPKVEVGVTVNAPPGIVKSVEATSRGNVTPRVGQNMVMVPG